MSLYTAGQAQILMLYVKDKLSVLFEEKEHECKQKQQLEQEIESIKEKKELVNHVLKVHGAHSVVRHLTRTILF